MYYEKATTFKRYLFVRVYNSDEGSHIQFVQNGPVSVYYY